MKNIIRALLLVVGACAPVAHAGETTLNETQLQGRMLLSQSCGVCHLQPALGSKTYGPMLNRTSMGGSEEAMRIVILNGTERMPAFKHHLKPAEVDAIIAYLRTIEPKGATR